MTGTQGIQPRHLSGPILNRLSGAVGEVFFVDNSGNSKAFPSGGSRRKPFATITQALSHCRDNRNDVVFVLPGHAETIAAAAGIVFNKIGVSVIGVGGINERPTLTYSAAAGDVDVTAANVTLENFSFVSAVADVVAAVDVGAKDFVLRNCSFTEGTDLNFLVCVQTAASNACDGLTIEDCTFIVPDAANTECIELVGAADKVTIQNNTIRGAFLVSAISAITAASTNLNILNNRIVNTQTTDIAGLIDLVAACTGFIHGNVCFHGYTTDITGSIDGDSCVLGENLVANVIAERGGAFGTASA